jgi:hypothetical protein
MFDVFLHYVIFSSAAALYGIGFDRFMLNPGTPRKFALSFCKSLALVVISVFFTFAVAAAFLAPRGMTEFMPVCAVLIFIPFCILFESLISIGLKQTVPEFIVPFLCVLLAVSESPSLGKAILAGVFSAVSYYFFAAIVFVTKKRLDAASEKRLIMPEALLLISVAAVIVIFSLAWLPWGGDR